MLDIKEFKAKFPHFLLGNIYKVTISKFNNDDLGVLACKVEIPQFDFTPLDTDIGGQVIGLPNKLLPGELSITFYNTGNEYKTISKYREEIFNPQTRSFKYFDDVKMDITVEELDHKGETVITHKYKDCILRNISNISLAYGDANTPEQFTATFTFVLSEHN